LLVETQKHMHTQTIQYNHSDDTTQSDQ